jgi:hypothetical protein
MAFGLTFGRRVSIVVGVPVDFAHARDAGARPGGAGGRIRACRASGARGARIFVEVRLSSGAWHALDLPRGRVRAGAAHLAGRAGRRVAVVPTRRAPHAPYPSGRGVAIGRECTARAAGRRAPACTRIKLAPSDSLAPRLWSEAWRILGPSTRALCVRAR